MKILVLDASALIMGFNPLDAQTPSYTSPSLERELLPQTTAHLRYRTAVEAGRLAVKAPSPTAISAVIDKARKLGDVHVLSEADIQVLALAYEVQQRGDEPLIVTDDYSIQNVADALGVPYQSLAAFGISHRFDWIYYCPACFRRYPLEALRDVCPVCGTRFRRKVLRKVPAKA